jgi:Na+-transporting NADH:ubiquinone oxidoreductase subunit A
MQTIKIKKGLDITITGVPKQIIDTAKSVSQVALVTTDFIGLKPKMLVSEGQSVGIGTPLFVDKQDPQVQYVAPGTGRIVAINRGERRKLLSVVIELDDSLAEQCVFATDAVKQTQDIKQILLNSGLWTSFRTRPFNRVAHSDSNPAAVFVTAIDTRPLAANPNVIIANRKQEFIAGMHTLVQLLSCPIHLCIAADWAGPTFTDDGIQTTQFAGPHPAGLVGTHIHHLAPVSADKLVWHIAYQDVIDIGYLFKTGKLLSERTVSIAGPAVKNPRLLKTRPGANINELLDEETIDNCTDRVISGSVLDGMNASGAVAFLGRYDNQISVLGTHAEKMTWVSRIFKRTAVSPTYDRQTAMIPVEAFDRIMPMDILMAPLLRALLVKDTVAAEDLGCLELAEEDMALSSFVCPAKLNYAVALRRNLNQIEQEG